MHIPGLAVGVIHGVNSYATGIGVANVSTKEPVTADTEFHIASVTKTFTATLAMMLSEQGVLDLNARIVDILPRFRVKDPEATAKARVIDTRPTRGLQHLGAMRLSAKAAKELGQGQAGLKLHSVECHGVRSVFGCTQITRPVAHQMSLAEAGFQSGRRMEVIWCDLLNPLLHVRLESE